MNTILQKRIEEAAKKICCTDCPMEIIRDCKGCVAMENAIKTGIFTLQNQWISVEEALPKENGRYLVYAPTYEKGSSSGLDFKDRIGFSRFCNGKWSIEIGYHKRPNCVTHWIPIPEMKGGDE